MAAAAPTLDGALEAAAELLEGSGRAGWPRKCKLRAPDVAAALRHLAHATERGFARRGIRTPVDAEVDALARVVALLAEQAVVASGEGPPFTNDEAPSANAAVQAGVPTGAPPLVPVATYVRVDGAGHLRDDAPIGFDLPFHRASATTPSAPAARGAGGAVSERLARLAAPKSPRAEAASPPVASHTPTSPRTASHRSSQPQPPATSPHTATTATTHVAKHADHATPRLFESKAEQRYAARERLQSPRTQPTPPPKPPGRTLTTKECAALADRLHGEAKAREMARARKAQEREARESARLSAEQARANRRSATLLARAGGKDAAISQLKRRANLRRAELARQLEKVQMEECTAAPRITPHAAAKPRPSPEAWEAWESRRQKKIEALRHERDRQELEELTFHPDIRASRVHARRARSRDTNFERETDELVQSMWEDAYGKDDESYRYHSERARAPAAAAEVEEDTAWLLEDIGDGGPKEGIGDSDNAPLLTLPQSPPREGHALAQSTSKPPRSQQGEAAVVHGAPFDSPLRAWLLPQKEEGETARGASFHSSSRGSPIKRPSAQWLEQKAKAFSGDATKLVNSPWM